MPTLKCHMSISNHLFSTVKCMLSRFTVTVNSPPPALYHDICFKIIAQSALNSISKTYSVHLAPKVVTDYFLLCTLYINLCFQFTFQIQEWLKVDLNMICASINDLKDLCITLYFLEKFKNTFLKFSLIISFSAHDSV